MKALQIKDWAETFETAESRKKIKAMQWFACPSGCESNGFVTLAGLGQDGMVAFGIFIALCQAYSGKFKVRERDGCFMESSGKPMTIAKIAALIRIDKALVIKAVELLSSEDVAWLQWVDRMPSSVDPDGIRMASRLQDKTGEEKRETASPSHKPQGGGVGGDELPFPPSGESQWPSGMLIQQTTDEARILDWTTFPVSRDAVVMMFRRQLPNHTAKLNGSVNLLTPEVMANIYRIERSDGHSLGDNHRKPRRLDGPNVLEWDVNKFITYILTRKESMIALAQSRGWIATSFAKARTETIHEPKGWQSWPCFDHYKDWHWSEIPDDVRRAELRKRSELLPS